MDRRLDNFRKTSMALASKSSRLHVVCECDRYEEWTGKFYDTEEVVVYQDEIYLSWGTEGAEPDDVPGESVHWEFICNCNEPTPTPTCVEGAHEGWVPQNYAPNVTVWWDGSAWMSGNSGAATSDIPSSSDSWTDMCGVPTPTPTIIGCCLGMRYKQDISTSPSEYPVESFDSVEEHDEFHAKYLALDAPDKQCCASFGNVEIVEKHGMFHDKVPEWDIDYICHDTEDISGDMMGTVLLKSTQTYGEYEDIVVEHGKLGFSRKVVGEVVVVLKNGECLHGCIGPRLGPVTLVSIDEPLGDCSELIEPEPPVFDECSCEDTQAWVPRKYESGEVICWPQDEGGLVVTRKYEAMQWEGTDALDMPGRSIHWFEICSRPAKFFFKIVSGNLSVGFEGPGVEGLCIGMFDESVLLSDDATRWLYSTGGYVHPIPDGTELYMNPPSETTNRFPDDNFQIETIGTWIFSGGYFYRMVGRTITESISCDEYKPVDCEVSDWFKWTECTQDCVQVGSVPETQTRTRTIISEAKYNGNPCPKLKQIRDCNQGLCPIICEVSEWSDWDGCDAECGPGHQRRTRTIIVEPQLGAPDCPELTDDRECEIKPCPKPCEVSEWSDWGSCLDISGQPKTCGPGSSRTRTRTVITDSQFGAPPCPELVDTEVCDLPVCSQDCEVSEWSGWSACSQEKYCGRGGTRIRTRDIIVEPINAPVCPELEETEVCNRGPCPCESDCICISGLVGDGEDWNGHYQRVQNEDDWVFGADSVREEWQQIDSSDGKKVVWATGSLWAPHRDSGQWVGYAGGEWNVLLHTQAVGECSQSATDIFDPCWDDEGSTYDACPWDEGTIFVEGGSGLPIIEKCACPPKPTARFYAADIDETGTDSWLNSGENNELLIDSPAGGTIQREDDSCGAYANFSGDTIAYTNFDLMGLYQPAPAGNSWAGKYWKNFSVSMIFEITEDHTEPKPGTPSSVADRYIPYWQSLFYRKGKVSYNEYAYRLVYDSRTKNLVLGTSTKGFANGNGFHQPGEISSAENSIELGVRYHAFCVFAPGYFRLYLDGEFIAQFNLGPSWQGDSFPYAYGHTHTYIGSSDRTNWFDMTGNLIGKIYEVEIYSPTSFDEVVMTHPVGFPWFEQQPTRQTLMENGVSQWVTTWDNLLWPEMDENVKEHYEEKQCVIPLQTPLCVRGIGGSRSIYNQTYDYLDFATSTNRHRWRGRESLPNGTHTDMFYSGVRFRWEIGNWSSPGFEPATGNEMNPWSTTWSEGVSVTRGECPI
jgi:hypothetical protein